MVLDGLAKIISVIIFIVLILFVFELIKELPLFWQSILIKAFLFGGSLSFISIFVLAIWKPDKFEKTIPKN